MIRSAACQSKHQVYKRQNIPLYDENGRFVVTSVHYMNRWCHSLMTHMCFTRPRWAKVMCAEHVLQRQWASCQMPKITGCACAGMSVTFSPPPQVSNPYMHHGTCVAHVPWCMTGSLTSGFLWSRWWGKGSQHSRRMPNPQLCVPGKRPMDSIVSLFYNSKRSIAYTSTLCEHSFWIFLWSIIFFSSLYE